MTDAYEAAVAKTREQGDQEYLDLVSRRLMEMAADIIMAQLLLRDTCKAPNCSKRASTYM